MAVNFIDVPEVPRENHPPAVSHWHKLSHNVVLSTTRHGQD